MFKAANAEGNQRLAGFGGGGHHSPFLVEDEHVKAAQVDMIDSFFENGISKARSLKHPRNILIHPDTSNKINDLSHPNIPSILTGGFLHRRIPCMNDGSWMFRCEKENVEGVPWVCQLSQKHHLVYMGDSITLSTHIGGIKVDANA